MAGAGFEPKRRFIAVYTLFRRVLGSRRSAFTASIATMTPVLSRPGQTHRFATHQTVIYVTGYVTGRRTVALE